jgi:hypothetical protein
MTRIDTDVFKKLLHLRKSVSKKKYENSALIIVSAIFTGDAAGAEFSIAFPLCS